MWRNKCINDTYEPGSTFKIVTAAAGLEAGVVKLTDNFPVPASGLWKTEKYAAIKWEGTEVKHSFRNDEFLQSGADRCRAEAGSR